MKESAADLHSLNVQALCRDAARVAGRWPLSAMTRLTGSLFGPPDAAAVVDCSAEGSMRVAPGSQPELWLHLQTRLPVTLQCQRCLQAMTQALAVDRHFRFVRGEAQAEQLDEISDDDVLVLAPRLDLHELLEDELILALPLVPRHAQGCPTPLPLRAEEPLAEAPAVNPFAALAALRSGRPGGGQGGQG